MKKTIITAVFVTIGILFLSVAPIVKADISVPFGNGSASGNTGSYTLLEPLPCVGTTQNCENGQVTKVNFDTYIQYAFNLLIALSAAAAVVMITWGGLQYMTSAIPQVKTDGIGKVRNAIWGLLLVLTSYIILRTINPKLVQLPSSLVPPLGLKVKSSVSTYFDDLVSEAQQYNDNANQLLSQARQAQADAAKLDTQKQDLQNQLVKAQQDGDGEREAELQSQIDGINNQIQTKAADVILNNSKSIMDNGGVSQTLQNLSNQKANGTLTPNSLDTEVSKGVNFINEQENSRIPQLNGIGAYDAVKDLDQKATADRLTLEMYGAQTKADQYGSLNGTSKQTLTTQMNQYKNEISALTDPAIHAQYQSQYDAIQSKINSHR